MVSDITFSYFPTCRFKDAINGKYICCDGAPLAPGTLVATGAAMGALCHHRCCAQVSHEKYHSAIQVKIVGYLLPY